MVWGWFTDLVQESVELRQDYATRIRKDHNVHVYNKLVPEKAVLGAVAEEDDSLALQESDGMEIKPGSFTIDDSGSEDEDDLL